PPTTLSPLARSLLTVLLPLFATQMLAPSKATPWGLEPTAKVPSSAPSLARSLLTSLLTAFVAQMLVPSKASAMGWVPTAKVMPLRFASYHFSNATCSRLMLPSTSWLLLRLVSPDPSPLNAPLTTPPAETEATAEPEMFFHSCKLAVCAFAPCTTSPTVPAAPVWMACVPVLK